MHVHARRLMSAFFAVAVSSCATYEPPTSGPTAEMQFVFTGAKGQATVGSENTCSSAKVVDDAKVTVVPADKRIWIEQGRDTTGSMYGYACVFAYSFEPKAGARYVSEYVYGYPSCNLKISRLSSAGEKVAETDVRKEKRRTCWW